MAALSWIIAGLATCWIGLRISRLNTWLGGTIAGEPSPGPTPPGENAWIYYYFWSGAHGFLGGWIATLVGIGDPYTMGCSNVVNLLAASLAASSLPLVPILLHGIIRSSIISGLPAFSTNTALGPNEADGRLCRVCGTDSVRCAQALTHDGATVVAQFSHSCGCGSSLQHPLTKLNLGYFSALRCPNCGHDHFDDLRQTLEAEPSKNLVARLFVRISVWILLGVGVTFLSGHHGLGEILSGLTVVGLLWFVLHWLIPSRRRFGRDTLDLLDLLAAFDPSTRLYRRSYTVLLSCIAAWPIFSTLGLSLGSWFG